MIDTNKTKEIYKKLSIRIRMILGSPEFSKIIDDIAQKNSLGRNQRDLIATEISEFLMGIKNREGIQNNLASNLGVDNISSQKIFSDIENKILNNIDNIYQEIEQNIAAEESGESGEEQVNENIAPSNSETKIPAPKEIEEKPITAQPNPVGQDFEKIIMNQAKAMQPARPADESGRVTSNEVRDTNKVPDNLPTNNEPTNSAEAMLDKRVIHNYIGKSDPYREPIE